MPDRLPARKSELTPIAERFPAFFDPREAEDLKQIIEGNIGPRGLSQRQLDRIKVPGSGGTAWSVPTLDGGEEPFKELSGFLMAWCDKRLYFRTPYAERSKKAAPPDCSSKDGLVGEGDPGGECDKCPLAKFGTDPKGGRGQACKQILQVLLLRDGHNFPDVVNIPPTSIGNLQKYLMRLGDYGIPYWGLITTLRLEKVQNQDGIDYARVVFSAGERLTREERDILAPHQQMMMAILRPMAVEAQDYYDVLAEQPVQPGEQPDDEPPF